MGDETGYLPDDFGARVRAAAYYWSSGGLERFAKACARRGMSYNTMRKWVEAGHRPPELSQRAIVQRLAEVSGLPEAFFTGEAGDPQHLEQRLAHIEQDLEELLAHKRWAEDALRGYTPEEAAAFFRVMRQFQAQLGHQVGLRALQDRAAMGHLPPQAAGTDGRT